MQAKIDYNAMDVNMSMNRARYNDLLDRFERVDTGLTPADVAEVYYGFALTPGYNPTDTFPEIKAALADKDYSRAAALADSALKLNPVSFELLLLDLKANELRPDKTVEDMQHTRNVAARCDMIANAIIESGRGVNAAEPFFVTSEADMLGFLSNVLYVQRILGRAMVADVDAVKINLPGSDRMHILYFDNTREKKFIEENPAVLLPPVDSAPALPQAN